MLYTKSLSCDSVITHLQGKDVSQPENREMWVEIIQMDDNFSMNNLEEIVTNFNSKTNEIPWSDEVEFFTSGAAAGWISALEIRDRSLFASTRFNVGTAPLIVKKRYQEFYVFLNAFSADDANNGKFLRLAGVILSTGNKNIPAPFYVPLPVLHIIKSVSAINNWDVSDLIEKSVILGLADIQKNNVEIKSKPPEPDIIKLSVDFGGFDNLSYLIKLMEENDYSIRDMGIGMIVYHYLRRAKKTIIKVIGKKRYKALCKKLRNDFRDFIDEKILDK